MSAEVLVVGAGPVGLTAAIELLRRDVPVQIIDRSDQRTELSKAVGINVQSLELLEPSGLTERLIASGLQIRKAHIHFDGRPLVTVDLSLADHRYNFLLALAQSETERILETRLNELGATVERQTELVGFEADGPAVASALKRPDGSTETVGVSALLGADGGRSTVRETLGIPFIGARYEEQWSLADVTVDWPYGMESINLFLSGTGELVFTVPIAADRIRAVSQTDRVLELLPSGTTVIQTHWESQIRTALQPMIDPAFKKEPLAVGLPAGVGVAQGMAVTSPEEAVERAKMGDKVILVAHETTPDDIKGMNAAVGILTLTGGATSHAAVVARAMDKPCVVGCAETVAGDAMSVDALLGQHLALDGSSGRVWVGLTAPVVDGSSGPWVGELERLALSKAGGAALVDKPTSEICWLHLAPIWGSMPAVDEIVEALKTTESPLVFIDMTPPSRTLMDGDKWIAATQLFPEEEGFRESVLTALATLPKEVLDRVAVLAPGHVKEIEKAGLNCLRVANTVEQMMSGKHVRLADHLRGVIGSDKALEKLIKMSDAAGMGIKLAPTPVHPTYALFRAAGG